MTTHDVEHHRKAETAPPHTPEIAKRLLTIREAAQVLGVGRTTVYELIANDELEVVHIGRSARIPTAAVDDFVDRLRSRRAS
jgi:excisionase family DNA binding protein